jgi:FkbM family methyltransferase
MFTPTLKWLKNTTPACWIRRQFRSRYRQLEDHGFTDQEPLAFARRSRGVVHVGANSGQEAWIYAMMQKPVLWFEPLPEQFKRLQDTISKYPNQRCICKALSDKGGQHVKFYVTNNDGLSSSMFAPTKLKDLWGTIDVSESIDVVTSTLEDELTQSAFGRRFDALVLDVQGAELKVLHGAGASLGQFRWILAELSDVYLYEGACIRNDVELFLKYAGFRVKQEYLKKSRQNVGSEWDVLFERMN